MGADFEVDVTSTEFGGRKEIDFGWQIRSVAKESAEEVGHEMKTYRSG